MALVSVGSPRMATTSFWVMPVWMRSKFSAEIFEPQAARSRAARKAAMDMRMGEPFILRTAEPDR
jgi:hypothetical protein